MIIDFIFHMHLSHLAEQKKWKVIDEERREKKKNEYKEETKSDVFFANLQRYFLYT